MVATRVIKRHNLAVSEIGLGCATLAFDGAPQAIEAARQMLSAAQGMGLNYFDTAPFYGRGLSERLVGDALRGASGMLLSSKVGRLLHPDSGASTNFPFRVAFDYSYDGIMRSFEHSFQRLGMAKIDILYAHDLGRHTHGENAASQFASFFDDGGYRALEELRDAGVVSAIGIGVNEVSICHQVMQEGQFDVILLAGCHTLMKRTGSLELFDECARAGTSVIIGGPFNSGILVGGDTYNYRPIPDVIAHKHQQLQDYCTEQGIALGAAALQFPLRHDVVKSVIPGPKNLAELQENIAWYNTEIPEAFWTGIDSLS